MKQESAQVIRLKAGKDEVSELDKFGMNEELDDEWMTQMHVVEELHSL